MKYPFVPHKKRAKVHKTTWNSNIREDRLATTTGREYFCWDGRYFKSKAKAEAHMRAVRDRKISGNIKDIFTFRVFKTTLGWGVFAR